MSLSAIIDLCGMGGADFPTEVCSIAVVFCLCLSFDLGAWGQELEIFASARPKQEVYGPCREVQASKVGRTHSCPLRHLPPVCIHPINPMVEGVWGGGDLKT